MRMSITRISTLERDIGMIRAGDKIVEREEGKTERKVRIGIAGNETGGKGYWNRR